MGGGGVISTSREGAATEIRATQPCWDCDVIVMSLWSIAAAIGGQSQQRCVFGGRNTQLTHQAPASAIPVVWRPVLFYSSLYSKLWKWLAFWDPDLVSCGFFSYLPGTYHTCNDVRSQETTATRRPVTDDTRAGLATYQVSLPVDDKNGDNMFSTRFLGNAIPFVEKRDFSIFRYWSHHSLRFHPRGPFRYGAFFHQGIGDTSHGKNARDGRSSRPDI